MGLFSKKERLATIDFYYAKLYCHINGSGQFSDDLYVIYYITYVVRYFYICDERQIVPMINLLRQFILGQVSYKYYQDFHEAVLIEIMKTLTENEKDAVVKLFSGFSPLLLTEDIDKLSKPIFKYTLEMGSISIHYFKMCVSPDKILLPLTVTLFFEHVMDKFQEKTSIDKLANAFEDLLKYYEDNDCRSKNSLVIAPEICSKYIELCS